MSEFDVVVSEPPALNVAVIGEPASRVEVGVAPSAPQSVEVRVPGPAGPPGPKGDPGSTLGGADAYYVHEQDTPSVEWLVPHPLNKFPAVSGEDSAGTAFEPDVTYVDPNALKVTNGFPISGRLFLS